MYLIMQVIFYQNSSSWCELDKQPQLPVLEKVSGILTSTDNTFSVSDCISEFFEKTILRFKQYNFVYSCAIKELSRDGFFSQIN